jgi:tRNA isopentenyl-2-thiomethyl-A-37 hydroxylase MiaE
MGNFKEYTPEEWIEKNRHPKSILLISANREPKEISGEDILPHESYRSHMSTEIIKKGIQLGRTELHLMQIEDLLGINLRNY